MKPFRTAQDAILFFGIGLSLFPQFTLAHGLHTEPIDFSLPFNLYILGSVIAVVISFITIPLFAHLHIRIPKTQVHRASRNRTKVTAFKTVLQIVSVLTVTLLLVAAFFGTQTPADNIVPVTVWVLFGVGLTFFTMLVGNVWPLLHPVRIVLDKVVSPHTRNVVPYPVIWGVWPAAILFFAFRWIENIYKYAEVPYVLGICILIYLVMSSIGMMRYGSRVWLQYGDPFGVFFRLISQTSLLSLSDGRRTLRIPGSPLLTPQRLTLSEVVFIVIILGSIAFDSLKTTTFLQQKLQIFETLAVPPAPRLTVAFIAVIALYLCTYFVFCVFTELFSGRTEKAPIPWREFALTLIPIGVGYELAHYLRYFLMEGQNSIRLLSDPFGMGWNIFGTAFFTPVEIIDIDLYWKLQVVLIVLGHIGSIFAAHYVAIGIYKDRKMAMLSQMPMIVLMIGYTIFSLWIIAQPAT